MKAFLEYIAEGVPGNKFTDVIDQEVQEAKVHKRWRAEYMTLLEHYEKERKEGIKEGIILGTIETMFDDGKPEKEILERIMNKYDLTHEGAVKYVDSVKENLQE